MENELKKTSVHGLPVSYEATAQDGINYLIFNIDPNEARVFFDQAKLKGQAPFEDTSGRNFNLVFKGSEYILFKQ